MALTPSNMMKLGTLAPSFTLPDVVSGKTLTLTDLKGDKATIIMFICNHCPFVKHIQYKLVEVAKEYIPKGISFIAINANDVKGFPDDSPENMKKVAQALDYPFPYLFDETQKVAKDYDAACTPDLFVFNDELKCVYRGQFDDSRPGNDVSVTGKDLTLALDQIIAGQPVFADQKPSIGCNIKWKS